MTKCLRCEGRGFIYAVLPPEDLSKDTCPICDGKGYIEETEAEEEAEAEYRAYKESRHG